MQKILYVGIGGFVGASLRYIISDQSSKYFNSHIPIGTLIVNILSGVIIALVMQMSLNTDYISPNLKLLITTGIMGGLTTFSTFSYETISLFESGSYVFGVLNVCLNLFLSLGGVILGKFIGNAFF